ncbi:hypothetical protein, partial [Lacisediminimonas sp.]|uniref:hypothetical protein n=1 Tax=Lacisediminimonas sp. TaxID=3060582 RepID=UPI0027169DF1
SLVTFFLARQKESYAPAGAHTPLNTKDNKKTSNKPKPTTEKNKIKCRAPKTTGEHGIKKTPINEQ